eukprot:TRINITY_DN2507_c0_g1_i1.p1 TRINITY_DN2507_c0_g1~~TRINITY_DN2507_c0_g1_i1.p1  ORF type:complete len:504 (+),score=114.10 TRINITY_DN2507_c0_g1_i1:40-1512(+)
MNRRILSIRSRGGVRHITGRLDDDTRRLCAIAGYAASGNLSKLSQTWAQLPEAQHAAGTEVVLQNVLYNGLPRTLLALAAIAGVGVRDRIIVDPYPSKPNRHREFMEKGKATVGALYGYKATRFLSSMDLLHPAYGQWVTGFMYGRVLSRPGVSLKRRTLCELASIGGHFVFPQFRAGILVALTSGNTMEEVKGVLDMTGTIWGVEKQAMVDALWRDMNFKRLKSGWTLKPDEKEATEKVEINAHLPKGEILHEDWSHLRRPENIIIPNWRHPFVASFRTVRGLTDHSRLLALLSAHASSGNLSGVRQDWTYLPEGRHAAGLEVVLQAVAEGGFHKVHNALRTVHAQGVSSAAIHPERERAVDPATFLSKGQRLLEQDPRVFGTYVEAVTAMHPDVVTWLLEFYCGEVFGREAPGLSLADRQYAAIASLSSHSLQQLRYHMFQALRAGASIEQVRGILDQVGVVWGRPAQAVIDGYWLDFRHDLRVKAAA